LWPSSAAKCWGVQPSALLAFTSAPRFKGDGVPLRKIDPPKILDLR
jgi:hypothetical protein